MNIIANGPAELEKYVEEHFVTPSGLLYSQLDISNGLPLTDALYADGDPDDWNGWHVRGCTQAELSSYENYGMVSGAFASAMLLKYKLTGDAEALERARRTFKGFWHVAEIGKKLEFGYLPKIYGNRFSTETSTDQYLYILNSLDEYRRMDECSAEERAKIEDLIVAAVEFWRKRNYHYTYFVFENMKWPPLRFPSFLALAYNVTGDKKYLEEAEAIIRENIADMPENSKFADRHLNEEEVKTRDKLIYSMPDSVSMDTLNATLYLRNHPESCFAEVWRSSALQMALEGLRVIAEDGQAYTSMYYNLADNTLRQADKIGSTGAHGARTGWSTMILRGVLMAAKFYPDFRAEFIQKAEDALSKFDCIEKFNYISPEDVDRLPKKFRCKTRYISGDSTSHALWCCYLLKELKSM